jgi:hypothetical protein
MFLVSYVTLCVLCSLYSLLHIPGSMFLNVSCVPSYVPCSLRSTDLVACSTFRVLFSSERSLMFTCFLCSTFLVPHSVLHVSYWFWSSLLCSMFITFHVPCCVFHIPCSLMFLIFPWCSRLFMFHGPCCILLMFHGPCCLFRVFFYDVSGVPCDVSCSLCSLMLPVLCVLHSLFFTDSNFSWCSMFRISPDGPCSLWSNSGCTFRVPCSLMFPLMFHVPECFWCFLLCSTFLNVFDVSSDVPCSLRSIVLVACSGMHACSLFLVLYSHILWTLLSVMLHVLYVPRSLLYIRPMFLGVPCDVPCSLQCYLILIATSMFQVMFPAMFLHSPCPYVPCFECSLLLALYSVLPTSKWGQQRHLLKWNKSSQKRCMASIGSAHTIPSYTMLLTPWFRVTKCKAGPDIGLQWSK